MSVWITQIFMMKQKSHWENAQCTVLQLIKPQSKNAHSLYTCASTQFQVILLFGIICPLLSLCLLPSRCSSPDWQASWWCRGQIRSILFLSALFYHFCSWRSTVVSITSCISAVMHDTRKRIWKRRKKIMLSRTHCQILSRRWIWYHASEASCLQYRACSCAPSIAAISAGDWELLCKCR